MKRIRSERVAREKLVTYCAWCRYTLILRPNGDVEIEGKNPMEKSEAFGSCVGALKHYRSHEYATQHNTKRALENTIAALEILD
jgi:hypothetical protein